jgi:predicted transposase/invertase (TIGR01784 family)
MSTGTRSMISFDWAIKRLLCNKANFEALEGFLTELLLRKIVIRNIIESGATPTRKEDKTNRVDILVEADDRELVIIELQFDSQDDYFQRMLYGVSRAIVDFINKGAPYSAIRMVYSVNIVYFDLGEGDDYVYLGSNHFIGLHTHNELRLTAKQQELYGKIFPADLNPMYYVIKVQGFNDVAKNTLDEWIYYLKNDRIRDDFTAKGLDKVREVCAFDSLTEEEKREYHRETKDRRIRDSEMVTAFTDGEIKGKAEGRAEGRAEGVAEGRAEGQAERDRLEAKLEAAQAEKEAALKKNVLNSHQAGLTKDTISSIFGLTHSQVSKILEGVS